MAFKRKKILLIYCGGAKLPTADQKGLNKWLKGFVEIGMMADVKAEFVYEGPGSRIEAKDWENLVIAIKKNYNKYDGFVITHGLDNLLLTSSLVSFLVQNSGKPLIFTGAPLLESKFRAKQPIKKIFNQYQTLGIKANLINAIQVSTLDFSGPCLIFGNRLLKPVRTLQTFDSNLNIFSTWQSGELGKIQFGIKLSQSAPKLNKNKPKFYTDFATKIKIIDPNLEIPEKIELKAKEQGIIIKSFQEDPTSILKKIDSNIPVLIFTQGNIKEKGNIISAQGYTFEAAVAKFMWALGMTKAPEKIRKIFKQNYVGEI